MLQEEISYIIKKEDLFKIDYLTIMIVGKSGVGKSTLINKFLELKKSNEAKVGTGNFQTIDIKPYTSSKVPYLRLVDTRGIELNENFGADEVLKVSKKFINDQIGKNISKDFVQCIWYCITGARLEKVEIDLLDKLRKAYPDSKIPIIFVYTQAVDEQITKEMAEYIKNLKLDARFIPILAGEKRLMNNRSMEPFGKEDLIMETVKKCEEALQGDMRSLMTKQISDYLIQIFEKQFEKTEEIEKILIYKFLQDFNKVLTENEMQQFIIDILVDIFNNFLENNNNNERNIKKILENQFKEHLEKYISYCKKKIDIKINSTLDEKCIQFLNIQVEEEIDKNEQIPIKKKRDLKRFKETTKNFLEVNLNYIYEKGYIKMLLDEINVLTNNIKESLKKKLKEEYILEDEIIESINDCFQGKFLKLKDEIEKALNINQNNSRFNHNITPYYNVVDYPENPESDNQLQRPNEENNRDNNDNYNYNYDNQEDIIQNNINNGSNDNIEDNNSSPPYPRF
jgi:GTP-binding protein EngB required for normal cell division